MSASILIIISALGHSIWNTTSKRANGGVTFMFQASVVSVAIAFLYGALVRDFRLGISGIAIVYALFAGLCEGIYFQSLSKTYEKSPLGTSYALMRAGAMAMVWIISLPILKEPISLQMGLGALAIFFGIPLCQKSIEAFSFKRVLGETHVWIAAACIAGYHIAYGLALKNGMSGPMLYCISMSVGIIVLGRAIGLKRIRRQKLQKLSPITGIVMALSFLVFLEALKMVGPGFGISLRNISILFTLGFSFFLGERLRLSQSAGVILMFIGAVLLSWKA